MPAAERSAWSSDVSNQLLHAVAAPANIVVLAGQIYREGLVPSLQWAGFSVAVPMKGLRLGEQQRWLRKM